MPVLPEGPVPVPHNGTPSAMSSSRTSGVSWVDLLLLVVVLGTLATLLVCGVELAQAITIVGVAGLLTVELRRRLS